uniref:Uncharacterized protein n=1 Tax=Manihot esculenta TaxID=3983 RepID=A0A2C9VSF0_MANES
MTCIENKLWFVELDVLRLWKIMVERMSLYPVAKLELLLKVDQKNKFYQIY